MIITWDFKKNNEHSMFQVSSASRAGNYNNYVVRGLGTNKKMNYFIDTDYINDLEFCIPMQMTNWQH